MTYVSDDGWIDGVRTGLRAAVGVVTERDLVELDQDPLDEMWLDEFTARVFERVCELRPERAQEISP